MKIMKIDEIAASYDRAKVSIGAGPRWHSGPQVADLRPSKFMKTYEILRKHMKSMKIL